jgi:protein-S-isoprenylcysteine O-methyltransferase Ste14
MLTQLITFLSHNAEKKRSPQFKIISAILGAFLFLVLAPTLLLLLVSPLSTWLPLPVPRIAEIFIAWITLGTGIFFLSWTLYAQWALGMGTPNPIAPTQKLIIEGPYHYCRNPLQLGAYLYYLGLGTMTHNLTCGLLCFLIGFLLGSAYLKLIEEKELLLRFGQDYEDYKKKTPFFFPWF